MASLEEDKKGRFSKSEYCNYNTVVSGYKTNKHSYDYACMVTCTSHAVAKKKKKKKEKAGHKNYSNNSLI